MVLSVLLSRLVRFSLPAFLLTLIFSASLAHAATDVVSDPGDNGGSGQLRQVIAAAASGDTINFNGISFATSQTITLNGTDLPINKNLTITGPGVGLLTISGNNLSRVFDVSGGAQASMSGFTVTDGQDSGSSADGGILVDGGSLSLSNSTISGCTGGLENTDGVVSITNCVITSDKIGVTSSGGSLSMVGCTVNDNTSGGGIYSSDETCVLTNCNIDYNNSNSGTSGVHSMDDNLTMTYCDVSNNDTGVAGNAGIYVGGSSATAILRSCCIAYSTFGSLADNPTVLGLGVYNGGAQMTMLNCTIYDSYGSGSVGSLYGDGLYNSGTLTLSDSTIFDNSGGGLYNDSSGKATVTSCIIAGNSTVNVINNGGTIVSGGSNLISDADGNGFVNDPNHASATSTGNHDQTGVTSLDMVGLANNGGPTETVAIYSTSPAVDGDFADATPLDQRGAPRPFGARNDIGAYEYGATAPVVATNTYVVTNTNDSGAGSLRAAVALGNANPGSTVTFDPTVFAVGHPKTITLTSGMIEITQNLTITGPGANVVAVSGDNKFTVFECDGTTVDTISGLLITEGHGVGTVIAGGGITLKGNLTLTNCSITNCTGLYGAGLYNFTGSLTANNCVFSGNTATLGGGGLYVQTYSNTYMTDCTITNNSGTQYGGGIYDENGDFLLLSRCIVSNNSAVDGGGFAGASANLVFLMNSTFSGNDGTLGGGIYDGDGSNVNSVNCTISSNTATTGGGLYMATVDPSGIGSTIIAGNSGGDVFCDTTNSGALVASAGSNVIGDADGNGFVNDPDHASTSSTGNHDQTGVANPGLAPLGNYGGLTETMALLPGSPAIGADFNVPEATDQRGVARPQTGQTDSGSFEYGSPVAIADGYTTEENQTLTVAAPGVLGNDSKGSASSITATLGTAPLHGTLTLNSNGSFSYIPNTDFLGTDSFTYTIGISPNISTGTVTIVVTDVPAPVTTAVLTGPLVSTGIYSGPVTVTLSAVSNGSTVVATTYTIDGGTAQNYSEPFTISATGPHTMTYFSTDAFGTHEATNTVSFTIETVVVTPPTAVNDTYSTNENTTLTVAAPGVLGNDNLGSASSISATLGTSTSHGTLTLNSNGSFTYIPTAGYSGADSFTYTIGTSPNTSTGTVSITVVSVAPPATTASLAGTLVSAGVYSGPVIVSLSATTVVSTVTSTTYTIDGGAAQTYTTPFTVSATGPHMLTYFSMDALGISEAPKTLSFTIQAVATPPTAVNDSYSTTENTTLTVASPGVLANDNPGSAGPLYATLLTNPTHGKIVFDTDGSFTYVPAAGYIGTDSFTYYVNATATATSTATVTITISPTPPTVLHTFSAGLQMIGVTENYSGIALTSSWSAPSGQQVATWAGGPDYIMGTALPGLGQGAWIKASSSISLYDAGPQASTSTPFVVSLAAGWNLVADPFTTSVTESSLMVQVGSSSPISLSQANTKGIVSTTLYTYPAEASAYTAQGLSGSLTPYAGYWMYAFEPCDLVIPAPVVAQPNSPSKPRHPGAIIR